VIELKTRSELDAMHAAGQVVARTLAVVRDVAKVGTNLRELDELAHTVIAGAGAMPVFRGYQPGWAPYPFPGVLCVSVNDVIVWGIPGDYRLAQADLVSVDCAARVDGWCAEAAITFPLGDEHDPALVTVTEQALADAIAAARVGSRIGDIARAVGIVGRSAGYGIPRLLGGHGVGRALREEPFVPGEGRPGTGTPLRPGMVLVIGPMFLAGGRDSHGTGDDGWSVHTDDGSRAAHVAHTVAITTDGPRVLTASPQTGKIRRDPSESEPTDDEQM
jgi:methionyl aminopeptidase